MALGIGSWFKTGFAKLVMAIVFMLVASSVGFYHFELKPAGNSDYFSALWWSVVTLTTVGYGDIVPATVPGRLLGLMVMVSGIGLVSTLTGNLASLLVERQAKKRKGLLEVKLSGHVIILGWNSYAPKLIGTLLRVLANADIVLVNELPQDQRDELAFKLSIDSDLEGGDRVHFVYGNPTQENVVSRSKPAAAKVVYILSQDGLDSKDADQQSIYAALTVRSMAPKARIYGEVVLSDNREHLLRAGVNELIIRGEMTSLILGLMGATPSVWPFFQFMLGLQGEGKLAYHRLSGDERKINWRQLINGWRDRDGGLPLALCHESKSLTLKDMMDEGSALDQFILELFAAAGQQASLGQQGPQVLVNPPDAQLLETYDGVLYLKPGRGGDA